MLHTRVSKKTLVLAILFGASSLLAQQAQPSAVTQAGASNTEVMAKGRMDGTTSAQSVGTGGWMAGGVVTGLFTGLIGTAVIWAVAGSSDVSVPADRRLQVADQPPVYQQAFEAGYGEKLKSKRKGSALAGGLLGTAALVLLVVSAGDGSQ